ncbi:hypothetical protein APS47_01535 [Leptospira kirschneri serovar Mozdok]|nr:hypothetical protein APS47_01535 [Leptospira kirschneri serovar Mozdok]
MGFLLETDHDSGIRARAPCEFGFGQIFLFISKGFKESNLHSNPFPSFTIFGDSVFWIKFRISGDFL